MPEQLSPLPARGTIEFEAARVAAAFGVEEWEWNKEILGSIEVFSQGQHYFFHFGGEPWDIIYCIGESEYSIDDCDVRRYKGGWVCTLSSVSTFNELMARGLYRLGFTDPDVLAQLPPLSGHEQIEARLTMPREFWPQKWGEEG